MKRETREYLDGERERGTLSPTARAEADAWERLVTVLREDVPGPAPAWLEGSVMALVAEEGPVRSRSPVRAAIGWMTTPSLRLSPLGAGLAAAVFAAALLGVGSGRWAGAPFAPGTGSQAGVEAGEAAAVVYVQFVFDAPGARSVAVAGDFNGWDASHPLSDTDGDGVWTGRMPLRPGVHEYMFVVDGSEWVTDPRAERWTDDGFGNLNAVVAISPPSTT